MGQNQKQKWEEEETGKVKVEGRKGSERYFQNSGDVIQFESDCVKVKN